MGHRARVAAVAISIAIGAGACTAEVLGDLGETQANEVVAALDAAGVAARKRPARAAGAERWAVRVAERDLARAVRTLVAAGLPRSAQPGMAELAARGALVTSPDEDRARVLHAVAGEVARTIEAIDGVVSARVHLAVPERDPLAIEDGRAPPRASVLLRERRPAAIGDDEVRRLVAGAVDGLDAAAVAVVRTRVAEPLVAPPSPPAPARPILAGALGLSALLGAALVAVAVRAAAARRRPPGASAG